ncbi:MAG TPA: DUF2851 family protein [Chthoniobacterales bacterium]
MTAAAAYRDALAAGGTTIREPEAPSRPAGELELQARWFSGEFGRDWVSEDGAPVRVEDFGRWNHEAGPDFVDARIRIGNEERRGAIELDLDVRDWERHGHAGNPAFREAIAHLFVHRPAARFFTRTCDHREVPQIALPPAKSHPASTARPPEPITTEATRARAILHAAARHRLDLKAAALQRHASAHGEDAAQFAAIAVALGYKRNQTPFLLLAQRVDVRAAAAPDGEALLFGAAGFLETPQPPAADPATRAYLRVLWEDWWSARARCERWILPPEAWHFAGLRPANHPHRRVAALAAVARSWSPIRSALASSERTAFLHTLESLGHPFWDTRFNLKAAAFDRPQALVGPERLRDILLNVFYPQAISRTEDAWDAFVRESGPVPATIMRATADRFFEDALPRSLREAVLQQGLLQLERDHRMAPDPPAFLAALRNATFPPPGHCPTSSSVRD